MSVTCYRAEMEACPAWMAKTLPCVVQPLGSFPRGHWTMEGLLQVRAHCTMGLQATQSQTDKCKTDKLTTPNHLAG
jgi:hypothetical protein